MSFLKKYKNIILLILPSLVAGYFYCLSTVQGFSTSSHQSGLMWDLGNLLGSILFQWGVSFIIALGLLIFRKITKSYRPFFPSFVHCALAVSFIIFILAYHMHGNPYFLTNTAVQQEDIYSAEYWKDAKVVNEP